MTVIPNVTVEVGFGSTGTSEPGAWTDISAYVRSGSITRGSSPYDGIYGRAQAGTASVVLDNRDARFTPTNLSGPYVSGGATQVLPMKQIRIRSTYGSGYRLWQGFADAWTLSYPANGKDAICTLSGTDGTKILQGTFLDTIPAAGDGEATGTRIGRILDGAGWPAGKRAVSVTNSQFHCVATTFGADAWSLLCLTADTEIGDIYFDFSGNLTFRGRTDLFTETRSAQPQGTFGDSGADLRYVDMTVAYDDQQIKNVVTVDPSGSFGSAASDLSSELAYGIRVYQRTDVGDVLDVIDGNERTNYQNYVLYLLKDPELRIDTVTVNPGYDPTNLNPQVLGRELCDRITVKRASGGHTISREALIRGIQHNWTPSSWQTTWTLQDATRLNYFVFNNSTLGRFDYNRFSF